MAEKSKLTPMMQQYRRMKAELDDSVLLFFRMGDFYEMFFADAELGAKVLDITLTKRQGIPMAGVPHHAIKEYLTRALDSGIKVALAEQMEDPKQAKGLVKREITRIITPGTLIDGIGLTAGRTNFMLGLAPGKDGRFGIAGLELSTGEFRVTEVADSDSLDAELSRLHPSECVVPEELFNEWERDGFPDVGRALTWTPMDDWNFDNAVAVELLKRQFGVTSLDGFGCRDLPLAISAAGAVLAYAHNNLKGDADHINSLSTWATSSHMALDRISQRNLELVDPLFADSRDSTLFSVLNRTETPMGQRLLREWILRPLTDVAAIDARLDAVAVFADDPVLLAEIRECLGAVRDLERIMTRLNVGSGNGRDMAALCRSLEAIPGLRETLAAAPDSALLATLRGGLEEAPELIASINAAIVDEPPMTIKEGGVIREGFNETLDEFRRGATEGKQWIAELQAQARERTGIKSLKVRYNRVFGYFIEVRKSNLDMVPDDYIRKQTLVNAERYITPELKEIEDKVLGAEDKSRNLEYELFQELRGRVVDETSRIQGTARALAAVDVLAALAEAAHKNGYTRPQIHDGLEIKIHQGRHPVIDHLMVDERFVPNDTHLDGEGHQLLIITGPNMAGKSTFIRQTALLTLMAQMGSFIPASSARIGIVDRIFTRIGAADDLTRGQSTFMVEMLETANILNHATRRSLIILDEIGRGTSTFDGLSIAWAVAEHIHNTHDLRARTLFATHYHELTQLAVTMPGVKNYNVAVLEQGDDVVFLRQIKPGAADRSYGIHVARLSGLPHEVLERAGEVLETLENNAVDEEQKPKLSRRRPSPPPSDDNQPSLFD